MSKLLIFLIAFTPTFTFADSLVSAVTNASVPSATSPGQISETPRWTIASLNGIRSYHDGANCFNGVATSLGYVDQLSHTDSIELRYFLENYCQVRVGDAHVGDVLTVRREGALEHGARFIGSGRIFEKNSIAGLRGIFDDRRDSTYTKKRLDKSDYFNRCHAPDCVVQTYSCAQASTVRLSERLCSAAVDRAGITALREAFQRITLSPKRKFALNKDNLLTLNRITQSIASINGNEDCALRVLVSASSVIGELSNLNVEHSLGKAWNSDTDELGLALKNAKARIQQFDKSERTTAVLSESSWIPN